MANDNVEIIRGGFEAFNARGVEGILPLIDPDFEVTTPPNLAAEPSTYRGEEGVREWFDSFDEVMEEIRWDARTFQAVGDRVVVEFTLRARGRSTGLDFGQEAVMVWTLRDGRATCVTLHATLDEALEAAEAGAG